MFLSPVARRVGLRQAFWGSQCLSLVPRRVGLHKASEDLPLFDFGFELLIVGARRTLMKETLEGQMVGGSQWRVDKVDGPLWDLLFCFQGGSNNQRSGKGHVADGVVQDWGGREKNRMEIEAAI